MRMTYLPHIPPAGPYSSLAKVLLIAIGLATIVAVIAVKQWTSTGTTTNPLSQVGEIPPLPERNPFTLGPVKVTGESGTGIGLSAGAVASFGRGNQSKAQ